jgi:hypothetical protein
VTHSGTFDSNHQQEIYQFSSLLHGTVSEKHILPVLDSMM